jgi:hypothetical protein
VERAPFGAVVARQAHLAVGLDADPSGAEALGRDVSRRPLAEERPVLYRPALNHGATSLSDAFLPSVEFFGTGGRKL